MFNHLLSADTVVNSTKCACIAKGSQLLYITAQQTGRLGRVKEKRGGGGGGGVLAPLQLLRVQLLNEHMPELPAQVLEISNAEPRKGTCRPMLKLRGATGPIDV